MSSGLEAAFLPAWKRSDTGLLLLARWPAAFVATPAIRAAILLARLGRGLRDCRAARL